jgi:hypothetical protein
MLQPERKYEGEEICSYFCCQLHPKKILVLAFLGFNGELKWNFCCSSQRMAALGVTNFFKLPVSVPYAMLASVLCSSFDPNPRHR